MAEPNAPDDQPAEAAEQQLALHENLVDLQSEFAASETDPAKKSEQEAAVRKQREFVATSRQEIDAMRAKLAAAQAVLADAQATADNGGKPTPQSMPESNWASLLQPGEEEEGQPEPEGAVKGQPGAARGQGGATQQSAAKTQQAAQGAHEPSFLQEIHEKTKGYRRRQMPGLAHAMLGSLFGREETERAASSRERKAGGGSGKPVEYAYEESTFKDIVRLAMPDWAEVLGFNQQFPIAELAPPLPADDATDSGEPQEPAEAPAAAQQGTSPRPKPQQMPESADVPAAAQAPAQTPAAPRTSAAQTNPPGPPPAAQATQKPTPRPKPQQMPENMVVPREPTKKEKELTESIKQAEDFARTHRRWEAEADTDEKRETARKDAERWEKTAAKEAQRLEKTTATADQMHANRIANFPHGATGEEAAFGKKYNVKPAQMPAQMPENMADAPDPTAAVSDSGGLPGEQAGAPQGTADPGIRPDRKRVERPQLPESMPVGESAHAEQMPTQGGSSTGGPASGPRQSPKVSRGGAGSLGGGPHLPSMAEAALGSGAPGGQDREGQSEQQSRAGQGAAPFHLPSMAESALGGGHTGIGQSERDNTNSELIKVLKELIEELRKTREANENQTAPPTQATTDQTSSRSPLPRKKASKKQEEQPKAVMQGMMAVARMLAKL